MRRSFRTFVLLPVLLVAACGFDAPPPKRTPPPPTPPLPLSVMAATLTIPAADIVDALDQKTAVEIANIKKQPVDCMVAECALDLVATRTGPITGRAADGKLSLVVPLSATAQLELNTSLFKTAAHAVVQGQATTDTMASLGQDWRLGTQTNGMVHLSEAQLKLGPIKMSFADIWNRNEERLSRPLFKALDKHVVASIKIKPQAERLWLKAQRPIRVGKTPPAWLVLAPERIRVSRLETVQNALVVSLGVDVRAHVVVADQPPDTNPDKTLPPPAPMTAPSDKFAFTVPVLLPYGEAAALALQRLDKAPIKLPGGKVRFDKLDILPSGQDVVVATRFCVGQSWDPFGLLDSCGEGYLRGQPIFDAKTNTIRIANVHYDIATEGMILAAMRWLAGDALAHALETKLVFGVARDLDKLHAELKTALSKPQGRGVVISGEVQSFGAPSLTWTADGFLATFPASGTIRADLNLKNGAVDLR
jgi:hypothetical protein